MHYKGIFHGDLKPDNIMLDNLFNIRIIDFGCARYLINDIYTGTG